MGVNIADLYRRYKVAGFETYGEQYARCTSTRPSPGIAIGAPRLA